MAMPSASAFNTMAMHDPKRTMYNPQTRSMSPGHASTHSGGSKPGTDGSRSPPVHGPPGTMVPGAAMGNMYGPDGLPLPTPMQLAMEQQKKMRDEMMKHQLEAQEHEQPWFRAETLRHEQEMMAQRNLMVICNAVDVLYNTGRCPAHRWTNDPDIFPEMNLGIAPFPPNDDQLYCPRLPPNQVPPPRAVAYPAPPLEAPPPPVKASGKQQDVVADPFLNHADGSRAFQQTAAPPAPSTTLKPGKILLMTPAAPGEKEISVSSQLGLSGGQIRINPGGKTEEVQNVSVFGRGAGLISSAAKLQLGGLLKFPHAPGEEIVAVDDGPLPDNWREGWSEKHQRHYYWYEYPDGSDDFGASAAQWERPKMPRPIRPYLLSELEPKGLASKARLWAPWNRLVDFGMGSGVHNVMKVFSDDASESHLGRVFQGQMDNMYLVAALNAISCRPRLARQLFLAWDVERSIYILRLWKNGTWVRVEVDDFVPAPLQGCAPELSAQPFCCRSEFFPHILWPSIVEKAYAKTATVRTNVPGHVSGGWEAIGGGGRVDEGLTPHLPQCPELAHD
eukprot:TRINITY_DN3204_c0_g2_i2.p1 TRINITY_DN3204_c0_g2~~TRINITY_DN3204_c0_g2_i2.p1  ORF type:complete len:560 (+),score=106.36 TRINITY_DN3204_c0_g2_i2:95-1774(+)